MCRTKSVLPEIKFAKAMLLLMSSTMLFLIQNIHAGDIEQILPADSNFTIDGDSGTEVMRVQSDGNVGIGTALPNETLEVNGHIRMTDGNQANNTVMLGDADGTASWADISALQDGTGTDDQALSLSGNTLTLEDGASVDLSSFLDNTDDQTITSFSLNNTSNILTITLEDGGTQSVNFTTVLAAASTDDQALSLVGNTLTLEDGGSVDLSPFLDNTNAPIPFISSEKQSVGLNETVTISYTGINFLPTTTVTIPGFTGTINSVNIVSPTQIDMIVSTDNTVADYNIVVANDATLNTEWTGNGVGLLQLTNSNGQSQSTSGLTCKAILDDGLSMGDGTYWINPDGGSTSNAFQVYCDMTTDGGGWSRIAYTSDLAHQAQFGGGDARRWLNANFTLTLTDTQINAIRTVSAEGKQTYRGTCDGVLHYLYNGGYAYSFGFRFHNNNETVFGQQIYTGTSITVTEDGCSTNNNASTDTVFEINDIRVPVINVNSRDNSSSEEFGSPLTNNPAWLR